MSFFLFQLSPLSPRSRIIYQTGSRLWNRLGIWKAEKTAGNRRNISTRIASKVKNGQIVPNALNFYGQIQAVRRLSSENGKKKNPERKIVGSDSKNFNQLSKQAMERAKQLRDEAYFRSRKMYDRSMEISDKAIRQSAERSKQLRDLTVERSREFKDKTIKTSKELTKNLKKILPPDIHENIYTFPNFLTTTRLICAPIVGYMILHHMTTGSLILFIYSCVTDFLDGLIARHWNLKSVFGSIIDPIADKALMIICTVCLSMTSQVPIYLAALILGRDIMLGVMGVVMRYLTLPAPKTLLRYFDFSIITVEVHPVMVSKINTALQMVYLGTMMVKPFVLAYLGNNYGLEATDMFLSGIKYFEYTVATTTIWSGLTYLFSRRAVKILVPWEKPKIGK